MFGTAGGFHNEFKLMVSVGTATILRRAGSPAIDTVRVSHFFVRYFFQSHNMKPIVAKVIEISEFLLRHYEDLVESRLFTIEKLVFTGPTLTF